MRYKVTMTNAETAEVATKKFDELDKALQYYSVETNANCWTQVEVFDEQNNYDYLGMLAKAKENALADILLDEHTYEVWINSHYKAYEIAQMLKNNDFEEKVTERYKEFWKEQIDTLIQDKLIIGYYN